MDELELGLPEGPVPWFEVRAEFPDGEAPAPPGNYPEGVEALHCAKLTVLRVQAGGAAGALARVEEWLGKAAGKWTVTLVPAIELISGR